MAKKPKDWTSLNIDLPRALGLFVAERSKDRYGSASEYVGDLIREDQLRVSKETLNALLLEGLDSGEPIEVTPEYLGGEAQTARCSQPTQEARVTRRLRISPKADQDLDSAVDYYREHAGKNVARRFLDVVDATLARLVERPGLGRIQFDVPLRMRRCRRWAVQSPFEAHQIFYMATKTRLEVLRVLHGARDLVAVLADD